LYSSEDDFGSSSPQEDSSSGTVGKHCVVWGDWNFNGKLFQSQQDASAFFKSKKRTELAAVQYYGSRQITRFMSKRMTRVDWNKMKDWCDKHSSGATELSEDEPAPRQTEDETPTPKHQRNKKSRTRARSESHTFNRLRQDERPATDPSLLESQSSSMDFQQDSYSNSPAFSSSSYSPSFSSAAPRPANVVSVAAALEAKGSSLSGKISVLEDELGSLASKASSLLKSIGADAHLGSSMSQKTVNHNGATPAAGGKLKGRLATLEEYATKIQEKAALLETEFLGAAAVSEKSIGEAGPIKKMIEAMAGKVDELKSRFSALDSAPLLDEVSRLERSSAKIASDASRVFKSFGMDNMSPQAPTSNSNQALKDRLRVLSAFMENLQRSAGALDNELGSGPDQAQNFDGSQKSQSIKDQIVSLGEKMQKMESRISALENSPIMSDVSKMEDVMTTLSSRTAGVAKAVGLSGQTSTSTSKLALAPRGSPFKMRLKALEKAISDIEGVTEALEQELSGNVGALPNQPQPDSPVAKVKYIQMQIETLNNRMSSLEQQV
jgi:hypothetical protein